MATTKEHVAFDHILEYLRQSWGLDFTTYKPTTLMRRVRRRMESVQIDTFEAYLDYLQVRPEEFPALFNTILINVSSFFRDADTWEALRVKVLPDLVARRELIRVWSAGCAAGQEPFSIAMLLAESLGPVGFRERVKIYATDVDDEALNEARRAVYDARQVAQVPEALLGKYFGRNNQGYAFSRELRRSVIFGHHDVLQDAPISRVDLLTCRNTLMYFNAEAQARVMARFYFSVNSTGMLVLGRAEMLFSHTSLFEPIDLKGRIFRAVPRVNQRERLLLLAQTGREDLLPQNANHGRLRELAFDSNGEAEIILDATGVLVAVNSSARNQFRLTAGDIGRPLQDLELSYRPAELRSTLDLAFRERRQIMLKDVAWEHEGTLRYFNITSAPLYDNDRTVQGSRLTFADVTSLKKPAG